MKKNGNQFCLWSKLEKMKIFTAEIACLKTSIFLQTDSVNEMNWSTSKLQSSYSLLEKLYEMNWLTQNFRAKIAWKIQIFRELIQCLKGIEILQSFINK